VDSCLFFFLRRGAEDVLGYWNTASFHIFSVCNFNNLRDCTYHSGSDYRCGSCICYKGQMRAPSLFCLSVANSKIISPNQALPQLATHQVSLQDSSPYSWSWFLNHKQVSSSNPFSLHYHLWKWATNQRSSAGNPACIQQQVQERTF
jgi:hypothetical protein